jgi:hypothetical protein
MELGDVVTAGAADRDGRFAVTGLVPGPAVVVCLGGDGSARQVQFVAGEVTDVQWQ